MLSYVQVQSGILCITSTYGMKFISFCNNPSNPQLANVFSTKKTKKKKKILVLRNPNEPKSKPTPIHVLPTFIKNENILVMQMDMPQLHDHLELKYNIEFSYKLNLMVSGVYFLVEESPVGCLCSQSLDGSLYKQKQFINNRYKAQIENLKLLM